MNIKEKILRVLSSGILSKNLVFIPTAAASEAEIESEESKINRHFSSSHRSLLRKWNGINLEVLKFFSCTKNNEIPQLSHSQLDILQDYNYIVFASEPAGFLYAYDEDERVYLIDTDGGDIIQVAKSIPEFICDYVFGTRSREFAGDEWYNELKERNIF